MWLHCLEDGTKRFYNDLFSHLNDKMSEPLVWTPCYCCSYSSITLSMKAPPSTQHSTVLCRLAYAKEQNSFKTLLEWQGFFLGWQLPSHAAPVDSPMLVKHFRYCFLITILHLCHCWTFHSRFIPHSSCYKHLHSSGKAFQWIMECMRMSGGQSSFQFTAKMFSGSSVQDTRVFLFSLQIYKVVQKLK